MVVSCGNFNLHQPFQKRDLSLFGAYLAITVTQLIARVHGEHSLARRPKKAAGSKQRPQVDTDIIAMPANLVDHPRFGSLPRVTRRDHGADKSAPDPDWKYHLPRTIIIPKTGIPSGKTRHQPHAPLAYYDLLKLCSRCRRPFIFFAEEQLYWYETLGMSPVVHCDHCVECRKQQRLPAKYQRLLEKEDKDWEDYLTLSTTALDLHAEGHFKHLDKIYHFLNQIPENHRNDRRFEELMQRLLAAKQATTAK